MTSAKGPHVTYDGIVYRLQRNGGVSRYFTRIVEGTAPRIPGTLLDYGALDGATVPVVPPGRRVAVRPRRAERYRDAQLPPARPGEPDGGIFHSSYYRRNAQRLPEVVTVFDFIYERFVRGPRLFVHHAQKSRAIRGASAIVCISEATRQDLLRFVKGAERIPTEVIHLGVDSAFRPRTDEPAPGLLPEWPFVLFVGSRAGYKNFAEGFRGLAAASGGMGAVLVGGEPLAEGELDALSRTLGGRVRWLRGVDDVALSHLYSRAECLVYPSLCEGFGLPVAEAMACGCPVVAVAASSVPEVAGDAALLVERGTAGEFTEALRALRAPGAPDRMRSAGLLQSRRFSWDETIERTLGVYDQVHRAAGPRND